MSDYRPCSCKYSNGRPKRRYSTRVLARKAAKMMQKKNRIPYRIYKCPDNTFWHITSDGEYGRMKNGTAQ